MEWHDVPITPATFATGEIIWPHLWIPTSTGSEGVAFMATDETNTPSKRLMSSNNNVNWNIYLTSRTLWFRLWGSVSA
jgi:hypothetical protein